MILQPDLIAYNEIPPMPPVVVPEEEMGAPFSSRLGGAANQQNQTQGEADSAAGSSFTGNTSGGGEAGGGRASSAQPNHIIANAGLSYEDVLNDDFQFDMDGHDVMVFLHIQKTGGTSFGRHLVRDLDLKVSAVAFPTSSYPFQDGMYHSIHTHQMYLESRPSSSPSRAIASC